jgi:hypothetical protein
VLSPGRMREPNGRTGSAESTFSLKKFKKKITL